MTTDGLGDAELAGLRRSAFAVAYRMLGSVSEAEDVVQEGLLRLHEAVGTGEVIASPRAYLSTIVSRLAIDHLRSARVRRERYVGDWLPEPLVGAAADDPAEHAEAADSLSLAFLVLLESLTPEQRAAFLLREVFAYGYDEIAQIVGTSTGNARQLAARARRYVDERRPRFEASRERRDELADRFFAAAGEGDVADLERLLADDVVLRGDGGGNVPALAQAIFGSGRVARTVNAWWRAADRYGGVTVRRVDVNGQPGAVLLGPDGGVFSVMALDIADDRVASLSSIVNPEKLGHLGALVDYAELRARRQG